MLNQEDLKKQLDNFKRPSLYLNFHPSNETKADLESHIGSKPFITNKDKWPVCGVCEKEMMFLFQLREKLSDNNILLQTFYFCDCMMKDFFPIFHIHQFLNPSLEKLDEAKLENRSFLARYDIDFIPFWNVPNWLLLPHYNKDIFEKISNHFPNLLDAKLFYERLRWDYELVGEDPYNTIGGYPEFLADPKTVRCNCCNSRTEFYFQLDLKGLRIGIDFNGAVLYCFKCNRTGNLFFLFN